MKTKHLIIGSLSILGTWTAIAKTSAYVKKYCTKNKDVDDAKEFANAFSAPQSVFMGYDENSDYYKEGTERFQKGHQTIQESAKKGWNLVTSKLKEKFSSKKNEETVPGKDLDIKEVNS